MRDLDAGTSLADVASMQTHTLARRVRRMKRRARRGFSLIEIVVAIAIIAMISAGITVAVVKIADHAKIQTTTSNAQTLRAGVKTWWLDHDGGTCPEVKTLIADGAIDRNKAVGEDAWGQPWRLLCEQYDVTIVSRGPDKKPDTEDDIRVPSS
jgi:prepilin-type N-terminal cleavage/methylation domain-containing protein